MIAIQNKKRPPLLTYLCIGSTFIGLFWVAMLVALIVYSLHGNVPAPLFPGLVIGYSNAGYLFLAAIAGLTLLGLVAVVLMWQMKKVGFYLYVAAKTTLYFMPVAIIGTNHLTFTGLLLTSMGLIAYGVFFTRKTTMLKPQKTKK